MGRCRLHYFGGSTTEFAISLRGADGNQLMSYKTFSTFDYTVEKRGDKVAIVNKNPNGGILWEGPAKEIVSTNEKDEVIKTYGEDAETALSLLSTDLTSAEKPIYKQNTHAFENEIQVTVMHYLDRFVAVQILIKDPTGSLSDVIADVKHLPSGQGFNVYFKKPQSGKINYV